ncbi:hypothetical protein [Dysgonomonas sp. BGC7]|uniref:hypothetical protein n=1 Tax=Dysgonomonas sp. BGC7 TaxID=1658008 RepID=UPI0006802B6D|nr:hypothetical protein [Dysgonomonas sp. BGC7]MBD8389621.1 hypothetical protein [Dysgonomonas sp. BGC7]
MDLVISVIVAVFAVLQIILFFKLWGMTNHVKEMKEAVEINSLFNNMWKVRRALFKGDKRKAKELLDDAFITEIMLFTRYSKENFSSIPQIIEYFQKIYDKHGFEMPEELSKLTSRKDAENIL